MQVFPERELGPMADTPEFSRQAEELGYDIFHANENKHDPFIRLTLAAANTHSITLRSSIVVAFPRSPTTVAYAAWDLQAFSGGRLVLGLGSQVRGHIVRRYSTPWHPPAPRMREYVQSLRAIWDCWQNGTKLDFKGDYYNINLMVPLFNPGPIEHPHIPIHIAAVNQNMLRVAGEVCDGVLLHTFNTLKYTREVILPNIEAGAKRTGRSLKDIAVTGGGFVVTGKDEEELERNKRATKGRIAVYASTRSYLPVMSIHGWDDIAANLYRMSVEGQWEGMADLITDEILGEFAVIGTYDEIAPKIKSAYGDFASSVGFSIPVRNQEDRERLKEMVRELQRG